MRQPARLGSLTSLRFFAALLVLLYHCALRAKITYASMAWWFRGLVANGIEAVGFFFVLSGFVLAYNYYAPEETGIRGGSVAFWKGRIARIYPAYFVALLIALPAFYHDFRRAPSPSNTL